MLVTIGAFDGFHRGHAHLFRLCRENSHGDDWGVITFEPHPAEYIHGFGHTLFTLRERSLIAKALDIPHIYFVEFSENFRQLEPTQFWRLIRSRFNVDGLVMGSDFHFGINREGSAELLSSLAHSYGIHRVVIAPLLDKPIYSSSHVRELVCDGDVTSAREVLGYPYFMIGQVIHGYGRGHTMHFPTANIGIAGRNCVCPPESVYACAVGLNGKLYAGAVSIGSNPTFGQNIELRCEVHIPGFTGDVYGQDLTVMFLERLRVMRKFSGIDELSAQIALDVEQCRKIFAAQSTELLQKFVLHSNDKISEVIRLV